MVVGECGDSMAAVQGLLKKHEALEAELAARGERVRDLAADGERLLAAGNLHADALAHRLRALHAKVRDELCSRCAKCWMSLPSGGLRLYLLPPRSVLLTSEGRDVTITSKKSLFKDIAATFPVFSNMKCFVD